MQRRYICDIDVYLLDPILNGGDLRRTQTKFAVAVRLITSVRNGDVDPESWPLSGGRTPKFDISCEAVCRWALNMVKILNFEGNRRYLLGYQQAYLWLTWCCSK
jgi:hypothetical protein